MRSEPPLYVVPAVQYNAGDLKATDGEKLGTGVKFNVHKFTSRPRPTKPSDVIIIPAFSEFGSETLIPLYVLPYLLEKRCIGKYCIVMGWYGRQFFYQHLVDEFWEIKEQHQYLREYCRAFHHQSKNLALAERMSSRYGRLVKATDVGSVFLFPRISKCIAKREKMCDGFVQEIDDIQICTKCGFRYKPVGLFDDCIASKRKAKWLPAPSKSKIEIAKKRLPPNAVGVVARNRKCYGRNLTPDFYLKLLNMIESKGYNPVWLGEKVTTLACPRSDIPDFSRDPSSRDLEQTLADVSQMKFTIQFWTASSRLAGMVGTPFIIFESPDQIWGKGQEGLRLYLTSKGNIKLVASHFYNVVENHDAAIATAGQAVDELSCGDFSTILGLVERNAVLALKNRPDNKVIWF